MARPARVPSTKAKQNGAYVEHLDLNKLYPRERTLTVGDQTVVLPGKLMVPDRMRILQFDRAMTDLDAKMALAEERAKPPTEKEVRGFEQEMEALDREIHAFVMELVRRRSPETPDLELTFLDYTAIFSFLSDGQAVTEAVLGAITNQQKAIAAANEENAEREEETDDADPLARSRSRKRSSGRSSGSAGTTAGSQASGRRSTGGRSASTHSKRSSS